MTLQGPVLIIGGLLAVAALLQLFRRWTGIMAWAAVAVTGAIGALIARVPLEETFSLGPFSVVLGEPLVLYGRVLVIEPVDRLPLMFICFTALGLFLVAWRLLPHSNFFAIGLAIVALLSGALMVQQVVYAALLVEMAAILGIFPLHEPVFAPDGSHYGGRARGGLQYMTYATLALPGLMITQLLLDQFAIFPSDLGLLQSATILLALSFAVLLGAVPFQSWLSTVATDGSPPVVTFLFTVNLGTVWFLLLAYLESYSWLSEQAAFGSMFTVVGLLMMVIGGVLAASQRRLGRIVGYATLVDNGAMFVALGTRQVSGLALTVVILMARPFALALMTLGLDGMRRLGRGDDEVDKLTGAAWTAPWRTLAFMVGGVAMAGFPLSLGFSARWGLYQLLAQTNLFQAILALGGSAGVMMGLVNALRVLLAPARAQAGALPEQAGASPARAGASPARAGASPASAGASPASAGASPAQAAASPASAGASPASAATAPAQAGASPASAGAAAAQAGAAPALARVALRLEDPVVLILILGLLASIVVLGVFPQLVSQLALQTAQGFTFFTK